MKIFLSNYRDAQRSYPWLSCNICGGLLYLGDPYWQVNGLRFCENCLDTLAKTEFAAHRYICGEEARS